MTINYPFIIRTIGISALFLLHITCIAQINSWQEEYINEQDPDNKLSVVVDATVGDNQGHPLIKKLQEKDHSFIKWMYLVNKKNHDTDNTKNGDFSPISYTVTQNGIERVVTYNNCVKIEDDKENDWDILGIRKAIAKTRSIDALKKQNLRGELPKGTMTFINANKKRLKCGINVQSTTAHVIIAVRSKNGELISTLVDDQLAKGWNNYKWNRTMNKRSTYQLHITVDGKTMIQDFKV